MPKPRKVEKWTDIVKELGIDLNQPLSYVSVDDVKRIAHEEPRLMAYIDSEKRLPKIFSDYGVFLLPVSSTRYAIVRGKGFHELEPIEGEPQRFQARYPFDMTTVAYGSGETRYLLHAYNSGLLAYFTGVSEMFQTVTGKMATNEFRFKVDDSPEIHVKGAGMDIDFGLEGRDDVLLFEGKARPRTTFLIRQLYYPYRSVREVTEKAVRPFFFVADPRTESYNIWEYRFDDPFDYESVTLVRSASFVIEEVEPPLEMLEAVESDSKLDEIPQADDFQKVADFPLHVYSGVVTARQWARNYGITERQGSYYRQAAETMGLVEFGEEGLFRLTREGRRYVKLPAQERADFLAERLLRIPIMNKVFRMVLKSPKGVGREEIATLIAKTSHLTGATPMRRASTVLSYFRWMGRTTGAVLVREGRIYSRPTTLDDYAM